MLENYLIFKCTNKNIQYGKSKICFIYKLAHRKNQYKMLKLLNIKKCPSKNIINLYYQQSSLPLNKY